MNETPKSLIALQLLNILQKYSDENHRFTVKELKEKLYSEYGAVVERKAIKRNLDNLLIMGYNLEFDETERINKYGEKEIMQTNWYLEHDFSDAELRLMIDSLLFSKQLSRTHNEKLIGKIKNLSSVHFGGKIKHIYYIPNNTSNKEVLYNVEILNEAIDRNKKVRFCVYSYQKDKKLHPRLWGDGNVKEYIVNPYQMVVTNGRYYLIGNIDKFDNIAHFRIDRIKGIKIVEDSVRKKYTEIPEMKDGFQLGKHMAEHVYMFSGKSERVQFIAKTYLYNDLMDWFGDDLRFIKEENNEVLCEVSVNLKSMKLWALQYSPHVKVISPKSLVEEIKQDLKYALNEYEKVE